MRAGEKAVVPAEVGIELSEQEEQFVGGDVEPNGKLGDLLAKLFSAGRAFGVGGGAERYGAGRDEGHGSEHVAS